MKPCFDLQCGQRALYRSVAYTYISADETDENCRIKMYSMSLKELWKLA